jgi:hypothetical protein
MAQIGEMSVFFTKAGIIIAWLLFVPGAIYYAIIIIAGATGTIPVLVEAFGVGFVASSSTAVEMIALGVAFGIAAEISRAIAGNQK